MRATSPSIAIWRSTQRTGCTPSSNGSPKLTTGVNVYWIRFFLTAVYSVMYCRDHARPAFHKALGIDINEYDFEVFRKTSEISRQVFPIVLDTDNPRWRRTVEKFRQAMLALDAAKRRGGVAGFFGQAVAGARAGLSFASLYMVPVVSNAPPEVSHLEPAY